MKNKKTFIIAEIGNNHEGKLSNAIKLIDAAIECKVDAVKFQTFKIENFLSDIIDEKRKKMLKKFQLSYEDFIKIKNYCSKKKNEFFSTPLDIESAYFLNKIQKRFKISSGDNNYLELIDLIKSFKKPIIISTGLLNSDNCKNLKNYIKKNWSLNTNDNLTLMHCVSAYPVHEKQVNLNVIKNFSKQFRDCKVGYSDHTIGTKASIYSVACGAEVLEKHFTLDKKFSSFRDHQLSADKEDMKYIVSEIRNLEVILGNQKKTIQNGEKINMINARRSACLKSNLKKDSIITKSNVIMLRPGTGITETNKLIGKKLKNDFKKNMPIKKKDLKK